VEQGSAFGTGSRSGIAYRTHLDRYTSSEWTGSYKIISKMHLVTMAEELTGSVVTSDHAYTFLARNCASASLIGCNFGNERLIMLVRSK
jgi:hypothetical protein